MSLNEDVAGDSSKKWFVLVDDRYRGPYSQSQILSAIEQGGLAGANLVWKEGMIDWEILAKVAEFKESGPIVEADVQMSQSALSFLDHLEPAEDEIKAQRYSSPSEAPAPNFEAQTPPPLAFNSEFWTPENQTQTPKWKELRFKLAALLAATLILVSALWQFNRSGFPVLKDLNAREARELSAIAKDDISVGDSAGVALAPANLREPQFYIASNAEDGTLLEASLVGVRDTMVDSFYYRSSITLKVKNNFAKTPAFVQVDGKPLAAGEYTLTVAKGGAPLVQKTFFLGGIKDRDYQDRLQLYLGKLRMQAEGELSEVRQITQLLERQFADTNLRFKSPKGWEKFHTSWMALHSQIEVLFQDLDSEALMKEFYHGSLYGLLKEATTDVGRLHAEQQLGVQLGTFDRNKIAEISRSAQSRLLTLRAKIVQAERQSGI
jgi:hypothetical protein